MLHLPETIKEEQNEYIYLSYLLLLLFFLPANSITLPILYTVFLIT
jgi:hypothetical protein